MKKAARAIKADAKKILIKSNKCDLLFLSHVIERQHDPEEVERCSTFVYLYFPRLHSS